MVKKEIYDRIELCNSIISRIEEIEETQAYILYSGVGIGKSSVSHKISKLIAERNIKKDIIHIKSLQNDSTYEGAYLKNIFLYIRKYYLLKSNMSKKIERKGYKKHSYRYFIQHQRFAIIKKLISNSDISIEYSKDIKI